MIATKEQEMKALEKIKKIVADLGEGSYLSMAFEGCFEIAEDNIKNDFGCSMKQRVEKAEQTAEYFRSVAEHDALEVERLTKENEELKAKTLTTEEIAGIRALLGEIKGDATRKALAAAERIVEYADNPKSQDFVEAVAKNRKMRQKADQCQKLMKRLEEIAYGPDKFRPVEFAN